MIKKVLGAAIVVFAIGAAVPQTRARMAEVFSPILESFRGTVVPRRLEAMADQLDARLSRGQGFPQNWEIWLERVYTGLPEDPWGNVYYLDTRRGRSYTVGSTGPDGEQGTEDDITVERDVDRGP